MGRDRQEGNLCPLYLHEELEGLGDLNLDRKCWITEVLQNDPDELVEVDPIVQPEEFLRITEPSSRYSILRIPSDC